jgi:hypothetical protein
VLDETRQAILESIKGILAAVGQKDYDEFRRLVGEGAILLGNLALAAEAASKLSDQDLLKLINGLKDPERILRLMEDLRAYLPNFGADIVEAAEIFPKPTGGAPLIFKNREEERELCKLILRYIRNGDSERIAKKRAKIKFAKRKPKVSMTTINRIWKRHGEILDEPSFDEFFSQLLRSWSTRAPEPMRNTDGGDKLGDGSK